MENCRNEIKEDFPIITDQIDAMANTGSHCNNCFGVLLVLKQLKDHIIRFTITLDQLNLLVIIDIPLVCTLMHS